MASNVFKVPEQVRLERLSSEEGLCEFCCGVEEYTEFLQKQAVPYQDRCISKVYLLKESKSNSILAYMALIADAINLCPMDKKDSGLSDIPFNSLPAVKLAKLAVDSTAKKTFNHLGTYMIALAKAIALECNENLISCRFLTVDADVEHNPSVEEFYRKAGFLRNVGKPGRRTISMRLDLFSPNDTLLI